MLRMTKNDIEFIKEVGRLKQTSDVENRNLVLQYRNGNKDAMTELMGGMIKFVSSLAKKQFLSYQGDLYTIHDLIAAGCLGIEKAIWNFDPNANTKFTSYAYWWILKMMYEEKKTWGSMCVSLDDPLEGINFYGSNAYDYADCSTLKDILSEEEVNERINLLRLKQRRKPKSEESDTETN